MGEVEAEEEAEDVEEAEDAEEHLLSILMLQLAVEERIGILTAPEGRAVFSEAEAEVVEEVVQLE